MMQQNKALCGGEGASHHHHPGLVVVHIAVFYKSYSTPHLHRATSYLAPEVLCVWQWGQTPQEKVDKVLYIMIIFCPRLQSVSGQILLWSRTVLIFVQCTPRILRTASWRYTLLCHSVHICVSIVLRLCATSHCCVLLQFIHCHKENIFCGE